MYAFYHKVAINWSQTTDRPSWAVLDFVRKKNNSSNANVVSLIYEGRMEVKKELSKFV